ncbi:MAG: cell wall-binding repeat-containing protein [Coriobacteriia bacterium]
MGARSRSRPVATVVVLGLLFSLVIIPPAAACTPPDAPFNLEATSVFAEGTGAAAVAVVGGYAYVADAGGLSVYDASAPTTPTLVGALPMGYPAIDVVVSGSYAYVLTSGFVVVTVDITAPALPVAVSTTSLAEVAYRMGFGGGRLYVAADSGLRIFDMSAPAAPVEQVGYDFGAPARDVVLVGPVAYVATHSTGVGTTSYEPPPAATPYVDTPTYETVVHALYVGAPAPVYLADHCIPYGVPSLDASADGLVLFALADTGDGSYLKVFDISNPEYLEYVVALDAGAGGGLDVAASGQAAFLAGAQDTRLLDAVDPALTYMSGFHPEGSTRIFAAGDTAYAVTLDGAVRVLAFTGTSERAFGATRYDTAVDVSKQFASATHVVIATGSNYPDALAGAPLAYALGAPLLLSGPSGLSSSALAEVERLGATNAIIIGGTGAVPETVRTQLAGKGIPTGNVVRIAGSDRFDTSRLLALRLQAELGGADLPLAFVATGANFPDALAAAGVAAKLGAPILLVKSGSIPAATSSALDTLGVIDTVVLGREGAVSAGVAAQLPSPLRIGGVDRYETAADVAAWAVDSSGAGFTAEDLIIATGANFPDALSSGAFGALEDAPTLLVSGDVPAPTAAFVTARKASVAKLYVIGGTAAVSTNVERVLVGLLR